MQKINPLYLALLLIILSIFIVIKKSEFKNALHQESITKAKLEKELKDIDTIKKRWKNSKRKLDDILKNGNYKDIKFDTVENGDKFILKAKDVTPKELRAFMNKLLNSYIKIDSLTINKKGKKADIRVEILK